MSLWSWTQGSYTDKRQQNKNVCHRKGNFATFLLLENIHQQISYILYSWEKYLFSKKTNVLLNLFCIPFGVWRVICGRPSPHLLYRGPHKRLLSKLILRLLQVSGRTPCEALRCTQWRSKGGPGGSRRHLLGGGKLLIKKYFFKSSFNSFQFL